MASTKLQELTDRLYQEGLSKGREEGEKLLAEAKERAELIIREAKQKAARITSDAALEAENMKAKTASDLKMASAQCLQAVKKDVEDILVKNIIGNKASTTLAGTDFIKEIIKAVAQNFSTQQQAELSLVLPESLRNEIESWVNGELSAMLDKEVNATFSKKIAGGFTIGPRDGSYFISLTDNSFNELIAEYIRPVTRKLLFGE